jgi:hypothetical protein
VLGRPDRGSPAEAGPFRGRKLKVGAQFPYLEAGASASWLALSVLSLGPGACRRLVRFSTSDGVMQDVSVHAAID